MDYGALIAKILLARRERQTDLAKRIGASQPTISRWKSGEMIPGDFRDVIVAEARQLGILENSLPNSTVPIVGYVGAGSETRLFAEEESRLDEAEMPPVGTKDTVAVVVRGDSMLPVAENNWLLYYDDRHEPPSEDLVGRLCIVGMQDGRTLVKRLYRARQPGLWDLHAPNASTMFDQAVDWAAKVTWIKPV